MNEFLSVLLWIVIPLVGLALIPLTIRLVRRLLARVMNRGGEAARQDRRDN
jgi:hypothetical protein